MNDDERARQNAASQEAARQLLAQLRIARDIIQEAEENDLATFTLVFPFDSSGEGPGGWRVKQTTELLVPLKVAIDQAVERLPDAIAGFERSAEDGGDRSA